MKSITAKIAFLLSLAATAVFAQPIEISHFYSVPATRQLAGWAWTCSAQKTLLNAYMFFGAEIEHRGQTIPGLKQHLMGPLEMAANTLKVPAVHVDCRAIVQFLNPDRRKFADGNIPSTPTEPSYSLAEVRQVASHSGTCGARNATLHLKEALQLERHSPGLGEGMDAELVALVEGVKQALQNVAPHENCGFYRKFIDPDGNKFVLVRDAK